MEMQVTLEDTKRASVLLIRKLFLLMQNLDALPSNVYLTMKLYYYDDSKTRAYWSESLDHQMSLCGLSNENALLWQSLLLTTSHRASRRANVTACGLKAWLATSEWVRCRRFFTPWEFVCQLSKADWRNLKKPTTQGRPVRDQGSRWVQREVMIFSFIVVSVRFLLFFIVFVTVNVAENAWWGGSALWGW